MVEYVDDDVDAFEVNEINGREGKAQTNTEYSKKKTTERSCRWKRQLTKLKKK